MQYIGIDFGTSNSLVALAQDKQISFVNYPDGNISNPTILYLPSRSKQYYIGNEAVEQYLVNMAEGISDGRLMLSIKTLLTDEKFDYTMVAGHGRLTGEDLVAKFLSIFKQRAEKHFSREFEGVVLGRPVEFSSSAIDRMEKAALIAGFKKVVFWLEPVAAALSYELTATEDQLICVVDIGGGTSDICVIKTSPSRSAYTDRLGDILGVSGVNEAGDEMSSQIMKHRLATCFGAGSTFDSLGKTLPFPAHLIYNLSRWHRINLLNNRNEKETLQTIVPYSNRPTDVKRLLSLIENHYGFELFGAIDNAKKQLSNDDRAAIIFRPLELNEEVSIAEFEENIFTITGKIERVIRDCLVAAAVKPADIRRVILTGGSSQVPLLNRSVVKIFGTEKILRPDYFSSVATGLGIAAGGLNS